MANKRAEQNRPAVVDWIAEANPSESNPVAVVLLEAPPVAAGYLSEQELARTVPVGTVLLAKRYEPAYFAGGWKFGWMFVAERAGFLPVGGSHGVRLAWGKFRLATPEEEAAARLGG